MGMMREQIDLQLSRIAAEARKLLRDNGDDAAVSQLVVVRSRELLRTAELDDHLHICDTAQHLLLTLGLDDDDDGDDGPPPTDVGVQLLEDPFDVDAFLGPDGDEDGDVVEAAPTTCAPAAPVANERRCDSRAASDATLRQGLSDRQLATLDTMSHFGWTLRFVRRPMFLPPIPVAFDRNRQRYVVIEPDGSVDEAPGLVIRD